VTVRNARAITTDPGLTDSAAIAEIDLQINAKQQEDAGERFKPLSY
jgi:hypothetical protein